MPSPNAPQDRIVAVKTTTRSAWCRGWRGKWGRTGGISSGADCLGAVKLQEQYGYACPMTVFPHDNKKYFSRDYGGEEPARDGNLPRGSGCWTEGDPDLTKSGIR